MLGTAKTVVILATLSVIGLTIIGCSVEKKFSDMQADTDHMAQTTAHMDQTLGQMNQTTTELGTSMDQMKAEMEAMKETTLLLAKDNDALKESMAQMFDKGRQGDSMDDRRKLLASLKSTDAMGEKVGYAVMYFMTF